MRRFIIAFVTNIPVIVAIFVTNIPRNSSVSSDAELAGRQSLGFPGQGTSIHLRTSTLFRDSYHVIFIYLD